MIPKLISFQFQRSDSPTDAIVMSVASKVQLAIDDINLKSFLPPDCDQFLLFVVSIAMVNEGDSVACCLKTQNNITDNDIIGKGSYFCYYLVPSYYPVISMNLTIEDLFYEEKTIRVGIPYIFNELFISQIILPHGTFLFN